MVGNKETRHLIETAIGMKAANDSQPVFERLKQFAQRGIDAPESLSLPEIRQISFALSLFLAMDAQD